MFWRGRRKGTQAGSNARMKSSFWLNGMIRACNLMAHFVEENITFKLPPASEVVPPPFHPVPTHQRPTRLLFTGSFSPQGPASSPKTTPVPSKQRKSYRRSVPHQDALAVPSLPSPKDGSLCHAALACVQQLQAASASPVSTQSLGERRILCISVRPA